MVAILKVWRPHILIYSEVLFKALVNYDYTRVRAVALTTP